jgi:DNA polymerase-3 subunit alpha
MEFAHKSGILTSPGRGSGAGSLLLYLLNVTDINPLEYNLLFSRFYNRGRGGKDKVSMPDVDMDFMQNRREEVIKYVREKYGENNTAPIITFGTMQGRAALKDVLRAYNACSIDEQNRITSFIPDQAKIADELQEAKDEGNEISIIEWALENKKELSAYCVKTEDGRYEGQYGRYFQDAIAIEGVARSTGKHAAGIIISTEPLNESCPMVYDRRAKEQIVGFDMESCEKAGKLKVDLLGISSLTKVSTAIKLLGKESIDDGN